MEKPTLIVDLDTCTGCRACMVACSVTKEGVFSLEKARISVPKIESICLAVPVICEQCANAPCQNVCPSGAISRDPKTGAYVVDARKCIGCKECVWACPFGAITVRRGTAVKCDLCGGDPECAKACTTGALKYAIIDTEVFEKKWGSLKKRINALAVIVGGT